MEFVPLSKELRMLDIYLQLQMLRFENKFNFIIETDELVEVEKTSIPPMLTQPFIENSVEHGLRLKQGMGEIKVFCRQLSHEIEFSIQDNGVGREVAGKQEKARHSQSMATLITRERLHILGKKFKRNFGLKVTDLVADNGQAEGTKVIITMPFLVEE
jgi:LytS/YehU family sensor histidine kinase